MKTLIAECDVTYTGRLETTLPKGIRLILIKNDGSVAIHCEEGAYKPLNWMSKTDELVIAPNFITAVNKNEKLTINIHKILNEFYYDLGDEPGLSKDGEEKQIQEYLLKKPDFIEEGLIAIQKEYPTGVGSIDLYCYDQNNNTVIVELKRKATIHAVDQICRYIEWVRENEAIINVRGVIVALSFTRNIHAFAEKKGIECIRINYKDLKSSSTSDNTSASILE